MGLLPLFLTMLKIASPLSLTQQSIIKLIIIILSAAHLIDGELFQATEHKFTFSAGNLKEGEFKPTAFLEQLVQFCADTIISTCVIYV